MAGEFPGGEIPALFAVLPLFVQPAWLFERNVQPIPGKKATPSGKDDDYPFQSQRL
jgi:hypothetical protein